MTQYPGRPDDPQGSGNGDDPYASPSSDKYGSLPLAGSSNPYGGQPQYGAPLPYGQAQFGQPYGQAPGYAGGYGQPAGPPPPNYLVWAVLSSLFCCQPLGIVSVYQSAQVNAKWNGGDFAGAREASDKAKKFAIYAVIPAVVVFLAYLLVVVVIGVGAGFSTT